MININRNKQLNLKMVLVCFFASALSINVAAQTILDATEKTAAHICTLGEGARANASKRERPIRDPFVRATNFPVDDNNLFLRRFGTGRFENNSVTIDGVIPSEELFGSFREITEVETPEDDNGAIPLAVEVDITQGEYITIFGELGNGKFGSAGLDLGDRDFYALRGLKAGQAVRVFSFGAQDLPSFSIQVYFETGDTIQFISVNGFTSDLFWVPKDGDYFFDVGDAFSTSDPFDSSSSELFIGTDFAEGSYGIELFLAANRTIRFLAAPGDVISAGASGQSVPGAMRVEIRDPDDVTRRVSQFVSIEPSRDSDYAIGDVEAAVVADKFGVWVVDAIFPDPGDFEIQVKADLPPLSNRRNRNATQIVYLDFDGQEAVDLSGIGTFPPDLRGVRDYSSVHAAFDRLELGEERFDEFLDAVIANVQKRLVDDLAEEVINPRFNIELRNSRDDGELWGQKNVTRVIVTSDGPENSRGLNGVAESIDVGNLTTEETTLVFADVMVGLANSRDEDIRFTQAVNRFGFVITHEVGHLLGAFHVGSRGANNAIMKVDVSDLDDPGEDGVLGTADDVLDRFSSGRINPFFSSFQDSRSTLSWGTGSSSPILGSFSRSFGYTLKSSGGNTQVKTFENNSY